MNFAYKQSEFATKKSYQHAIEHGFNGKNKDNKKVKKRKSIIIIYITVLL